MSAPAIARPTNDYTRFAPDITIRRLTETELISFSTRKLTIPRAQRTDKRDHVIPTTPVTSSVTEAQRVRAYRGLTTGALRMALNDPSIWVSFAGTVVFIIGVFTVSGVSVKTLISSLIALCLMPVLVYRCAAYHSDTHGSTK